MDKIGKIVFVFSLLGVCVLYWISLFLTPPFVPLDEIALYEGAVVRTQGVVTDFSVTASGNVLMRLEGNQTGLLLFVESADDNQELLKLSYGDEIEVEGRVQVYQGDYELVCAADGIKKLTQQGSDIFFVAQIAEQPEEYEGRRIRVAGYAEDVYTRVFYLRDETGAYRMRVKPMAADSSISELQEGERVLAEGVISYDAENMRYELNLIGLSV